MKIYFLFVLIIQLSVFAKDNCSNFPQSWWSSKLTSPLKSWEIAPSSVTCLENKVILSKRNELGILSNFASTPFTLDGQLYASVEGFWQMMKFPEDSQDLRYPETQKTVYTRQIVQNLTAFQAKKAGDIGSQIMKKLNINWVTYQSRKLIYKTSQKLAHYKLIKRAMVAKLKQNPEVKKVLTSTGNLTLLPDHQTSKADPPAWKYYDIWMEIREDLKEKGLKK